MLTHLDHVIVAVRDLPAATKTFSALLGRRPSWRGGHPALGTANTLFRLDNTYVELLAPAAAKGFGAVLGARLATEGEGVLGLAFRTPDAASCSDTLRGRGVQASLPAPGEGRDEGGGATRRWQNVLLPAEASRGLLIFAIQHLDPEDRLPTAPLEGTAPACVYGLDHVVVVSGDLEATRAFYGEKLGLRQALDRVFEERKLRLVFFRVGGVTVEIAHRLGTPPEPLDRFLGLSFQVHDAEAARERVAAAGFDVSPVRPGLKPGTRVCTVRGKPLGIDTLLIEPAARTDGAVR
jgi:catechol 2,3-dioxygenase-like lactoylglutathione lyase family enzyme